MKSDDERILLGHLEDDRVDRAERSQTASAEPRAPAVRKPKSSGGLKRLLRRLSQPSTPDG